MFFGYILIYDIETVFKPKTIFIRFYQIYTVVSVIKIVFT